ncbi:unnamed protein product [Chondrus crispus]|uniref:CDT1 Geminin-binding domain-containing protein n=1 Tax=Chondrus crispus TaxID=2769 RepID=R7QNS9_CHOCR|nr:unnamed protein product [Chondrus crispus]CDF39020.1 unnamed protein product [Chondrus crispus]|eukprot:XP_005718925.1 unnamed protein product [Chondrus crispus]
MGPARNHKRKTSVLPSEGMQQQNISAMLGERITKPRTFHDGIPPMLKRRKTDATGAPSEIPAAKEPPAPAKPAVLAQKRRWRLAEILEKDREARKIRTQGAPAFVFLAPHIDTKRPDVGSHRLQLPPPQQAKPRKKKGLKQVRFAADVVSSPSKKDAASPSTCIHLRESSRAIQVRAGSSVSGGEAILYSRDMLPQSHLLLLDVLIGLESAVALLKTRRTMPTVAAVREIVQRSTKRNFTPKILSQLAHLIPEAIAVVPGTSSPTKKRARLDSFLIRLDSVDADGDGGASPVTGKNTGSSVIGDSAARIRRSLLHKRLLAQVKEEHGKFLRKRSISRHEGDLWHEDFDLEVHVKELPAPPLYSVETVSPSRPKPISLLVQPDAEKKSKLLAAKIDVSADASKAEERIESHDIDDCIPAGLLQKVRARSEAQKVHAVKMETEKATNRTLLSKLPVTMDTVCSILRTERRSAVGWRQLIGKVEKLHPKKWSKEDLDRQLNAIATLGSDWCKKVELKSSRGGFAFRVHSETSYVSARAKVSATVSYSVDD